MTVARDAREACIRRWLPTLDEARIRKVEALVVELAVEQQNEGIERGLVELRDAEPIVDKRLHVDVDARFDPEAE